jgi:hypothetical protein
LFIASRVISWNESGGILLKSYLPIFAFGKSIIENGKFFSAKWRSGLDSNSLLPVMGNTVYYYPD